jgi:hypothetical protein
VEGDEHFWQALHADWNIKYVKMEPTFVMVHNIKLFLCALVVVEEMNVL